MGKARVHLLIGIYVGEYTFKHDNTRLTGLFMTTPVMAVR